MRKLFLTIVAAISIFSAAAQQRGEFGIEHAQLSSRSPIVFGFGPRMGVNYAMVGGDDSGDRKAVVGFTMGGTIDMQFRTYLSVSLDILYSSGGYESKLSNERVDLSYVISPVLLNFHVDPRVSLKIGIQPSFLMGAKRNTDGERVDCKNDWNIFDIGLPVGVGYMINRNIEVDLRYVYGLKSATNSLGSGKYTNSVLTVGFSYRF